MQTRETETNAMVSEVWLSRQVETLVRIGTLDAAARRVEMSNWLWKQHVPLTLKIEDITNVSRGVPNWAYLGVGLCPCCRCRWSTHATAGWKMDGIVGGVSQPWLCFAMLDNPCRWNAIDLLHCRPRSLLVAPVRLGATGYVMWHGHVWDIG